MRLTSFCLFVLTNAFTLSVQAQNAYKVPAGFNDLNTVYTYSKSNRDGSNESVIYLYVRDSAHLESFKWSEGDEWATLVGAEINWQYGAIKHFTNHRIIAGGERKKIAELVVKDGRNLQFTVGDFSDSMTLLSEFWHSYDFDFAGLGFSWRALKDKKAPFSFLIADAAFVNNKIGFENKGMVQVHYKGEEILHNKLCFKYHIDGPGLQHKGGNIWIDPATWMIEEYSIALPDEEGYRDGRLSLTGVSKITPSEWELFISEKMQKK